jgi:hypothetical protein
MRKLAAAGVVSGADMTPEVSNLLSLQKTNSSD